MFTQHAQCVCAQGSHTREEQLKAEERSKVKAGLQYENNRRGLAQSLKSKQETLQSKLRQGESCFLFCVHHLHSLH